MLEAGKLDRRVTISRSASVEADLAELREICAVLRFPAWKVKLALSVVR